MDDTTLQKLKSNVKPLMYIEGVEAVLLFGSHVENKGNQRSDIDLCVVTPTAKKSSEKAAILSKIWRQIDGGKYDIWLFEELPLYMKMQVIKTHDILHCSDIPSLYEYFYWFRKLWSDEAHRQEMGL
jgi:hypothetical protein